MKTMEETKSRRILWDCSPQQLVAHDFPKGSTLEPIQQTMPKSINSDAVYCQTYRVKDGFGAWTETILTEVPDGN